MLFYPGPFEARSCCDVPCSWTFSNYLLLTGVFLCPVSTGSGRLTRDCHRRPGFGITRCPSNVLCGKEGPVQNHTLRLGFISLWSFTFGRFLSILLAVVISTRQNYRRSCVECPSSRSARAFSSGVGTGTSRSDAELLLQPLLWPTVLIGGPLGFPRTTAGFGGSPGLTGLSIASCVHS